MISPVAAVPRSPGLGQYTCCARNHVLVDPKSGKEKQIPCKLPTCPMLHRPPAASAAD